MAGYGAPFLSEAEIIAYRMERFHRQAVDRIASGQSPLGKRPDGYLIVHLIPRESVLGQLRFGMSQLQEHAAKITTPADGASISGSPRFNVDGLLFKHPGSDDSYVQLYRDGSLEAVNSRVTYVNPRQEGLGSGEGQKCLSDPYCERLTMTLVKQYVEYCQGLNFAGPVTLLSTLAGCLGAGRRTKWGTMEGDGVDRTLAFLPVIEIEDLQADPMPLIKSWCDFLAQAAGCSKSRNFNAAGEWRESQQ